MKLNHTKCEGLWIGNQKYRQHDCKVANIKWPTSPICYLGIYIGHNSSDCYTLNWDKQITKLSNVLQMWKKRDLTLFGKIQIIKSLAISKIVYVANLTALPTQETIAKINNELFSFIWGKKDKIKRLVLLNNIESGGLHMIDVQSQLEALKAAWIPRVLKEQCCNWCALSMSYITSYGPNLAMLKSTLTTLKSGTFLNKIPLFYQQVIVAFTKAKQVDSNTFENTILDSLVTDTLFTMIKKCRKQFISKTGFSPTY